MTPEWTSQQAMSVCPLCGGAPNIELEITDGCYMGSTATEDLVNMNQYQLLLVATNEFVSDKSRLVY